MDQGLFIHSSADGLCVLFKESFRIIPLFIPCSASISCENLRPPLPESFEGFVGPVAGPSTRPCRPVRLIASSLPGHFHFSKNSWFYTSSSGFRCLPRSLTMHLSPSPRGKSSFRHLKTESLLTPFIKSYNFV